MGGYYGLNLRATKAKEVEMFALMGMKTRRRLSVLPDCEGRRSGLD